jgi:hypothetical protein
MGGLREQPPQRQDEQGLDGTKTHGETPVEVALHHGGVREIGHHTNSFMRVAPKVAMEGGPSNLGGAW